jgi:toxin coregulated pilus biosynthesis protein E
LVAFGISINRWTGHKRAKLDNYLPYSIFRDYNGALFLTSLAAMMKSGAGVMESLRNLETLSTPWMKWHIQQMVGRLDQFSEEPAKALDTGSVPRAIMDRIIDYGKRSSFLEAMAMIGLDSLARTEEKLNKSANKINMFMMLIAGVLFILVIAGTMMTGLHAQDVIRAKIS